MLLRIFLLDGVPGFAADVAPLLAVLAVATADAGCSHRSRLSSRTAATTASTPANTTK